MDNDPGRDTSELAIRIYNSIYTSGAIGCYAPDALIRVLSYLAQKNGWSLEDTKREVLIALEYYRINEPIECDECKKEDEK